MGLFSMFKNRDNGLKATGWIVALLVGILLVGQGCAPETAEDADASGFSAPTDITRKMNARVREELPFGDQDDFEEARRGLIASAPHLQIKDAEGASLWDMPPFDFIQGPAPASVNPSLWRQAQLNNIHGLFEVTPGIYQLRGFDLANMTIIAGDTGWIIVDPLTTRETAAAAMAFAGQHLKRRPVSAIILYPQPHRSFRRCAGRHFGRRRRRRQRADYRPARVSWPRPPVKTSLPASPWAAGPPTSSATTCQLPRGPMLIQASGKKYPSGAFGILKPNTTVDQTHQAMTIDGVRFVFQYTPESEAPAELTFYLPDLKAFCGADIVSRNMHNLYTLRGAKVRDALKWSNYIDEAIDLFGSADIYFASHHWPIWGNQKILNFLEKQRDLYKYIHDQTMRLANAGYTPREIAEQIELPPSLNTFFSNRGYYGTLSHNSKAVYQAYLGWYDGNPAHLNPLPPEESAERYVAYMGGAEEILAKARKSFDKGDYRWVAEVLNHLVFAEPGNQRARLLLARTYDQLGYQAESGVWRNAFLTAAYELRHGVPDKGMDLSKAAELLKRTPLPMFFDSMAVRLDGPKAAGQNMVLNIIFTDIGESYVLTLKNAVLHHRAAPPDPRADATLKVTHDLFVRMLIGQAGLKETLFSDQLEISGSRMDLLSFLMLLDKPESNFNIVLP